MYSDGVFGWVAWILLGSLDFLAESRRTEASAPPLGPGGVPRRYFQPSYREKKFSYQQGSPSYQQNPRYQPKKRRYLYNSLLCGKAVQR